MRPTDPRERPELPEALGDFQVEGLLGEGGSGTVYDARWGHRRVALKVLRADLIPNQRERERFLAEAALLAEVEHPGVVKVLGSGLLPDGRPYLAMEKLEGELLAATAARGAMPLTEAIGIFGQLASAVGALHDRGLIHRDIKLENVVVTGGHAVLLDFGIAKPESAPATTITQEGGIRGTPEYMAPERFFGAPASAASDIYELAVVLYALLCGRLPWDHAGDPAARLDPPPPSKLGAKVPAAVETELLRALSTRPETRPASVRELDQHIGEAALATRGAEPRHTADLGSPPSPLPNQNPNQSPNQSPNPNPTNRKLWLLLLVAFLVALVPGVLTMLRDDPRERASAGSAAEEDPGPDSSAAAPSEKGNPQPAEALTSPPAFWGEGAEPPPHLEQVLSLHPRDTVLLAGLSYRKLRESPLVVDAMEAREEDEAAWLAELEALCGGDALEGLDTLTVGAAKAELKGPAIDLTLTGRWRRERIERCLALFQGEAQVTRHGAIAEMSAPGKRAFTAWRDGVLFVSTREDADRSWMRERLAGKDPVSERREVTALLKEVDASAALWIVAWVPSDSAPFFLGIDPPDALYATVRLTDQIDVYAGLRFESEEAARTAAVALQKQLDAFREDPLAAMWLSDTSFGVEESDVVLTAHLGGFGAAATVQALLRSLDQVEP